MLRHCLGLLWSAADLGRSRFEVVIVGGRGLSVAPSALDDSHLLQRGLLLNGLAVFINRLLRL